MRATALLMEEHEIILKALRVLEALTSRAAGGGEVPAQAASGVVAFFAGFADEHHHGKEEGILFPALEEAGFPHDAGPLAVMHHEHDQGRALIGDLREAAAQASSSAQARGRFAQAARDYAALLSQHIEKENNILFRMADQAIEGPQRQRVEEAFDEFERDAAGRRAHHEQAIEQLAREML